MSAWVEVAIVLSAVSFAVWTVFIWFRRTDEIHSDWLTPQPEIFTLTTPRGVMSKDGARDSTNHRDRLSRVD